MFYTTAIDVLDKRTAFEPLDAIRDITAVGIQFESNIRNLQVWILKQLLLFH